MSVVRVLLIAAVLGVVAGVVLAFHRERVEREELAAVEAAPDALVDPALEALEPPVQTGHVGLAAVEGLPQYPGAFVRPISSGAEINIAWFATKDSVKQVLDFYEKEFREKGKSVVGHEYSEFAGYVGYMDLGDTKMHLVSVLRQGEESMVFPSTSYPEAMLAGGASPPAGVPNIAGAEGSLGFDLGQRHVWMASFPGKTVADVTEAWRKALLEKGYEVSRSEEKGMARLDAKGSGGSVEVSIKKDATELVAVTVNTSGPRAVP